MNCEIKKAKNSFNNWSLKLTGITEGMILSLVNGMEKYAKESPVGSDVHQFIKYAYDKAKEETCQTIKPA